MRGSTSSNPIVVEDELNIPHIGCKTRLPPPVDPALLPTPSTEEIIASLIKQKNIFPVLESILKFIATNDSQNTAPPARSAFERSNRSDSEGPPGKKRKLGSVPAGAVDWDVPYPFSDGEGPHAYRTNWEKERGKQLINQLVGLIKSAARTAATRTYFQQQQGERRSHTGYYRPATATYGLMDPPQVLADNSNINIVHVPPHNAHPTPRPGSPSLDQFVASLLQSPEQSYIYAEPVQGSSVLTQDSDIPSGSLTPDFDQGLFDNWLSLLRAFPIPQLPISNQNNVKTSLLTNVTTSSGSTYEPPINAIDTNALPAHDLMLDFAIDPALLAMSVPQAQLSSFSSGGPVLPPGPLPSPMASTSSLTDPLTPNWDHTFPEPDIFFTDQGMYHHVVQSSLLSQVANLFAAEDPMTAANMLLQLGNPSSFINQPPSKPPPPPTQPLSYCSPPPPSLPTPSTLTAKSWTTAVPSFTVAPGRSGASKPSAREDILLRAREQRRQLSAEIARAKVELWEATIEQGVLAQILKDKV
jgi:hypothetical protein